MLVDVRVTILLVNDKSLQWIIETREDHDSILYKTAYRDVNRCKHFERLLLRCCHLIGRLVRDALFCALTIDVSMYEHAIALETKPGKPTRPLRVRRGIRSCQRWWLWSPRVDSACWRDS